MGLFPIPLEVNTLHTFSSPSSLRLITSKSKSVLRPLVLLKVILPVRPSQWACGENNENISVNKDLCLSFFFCLPAKMGTFIFYFSSIIYLVADFSNKYFVIANWVEFASVLTRFKQLSVLSNHLLLLNEINSSSVSTAPSLMHAVPFLFPEHLIPSLSLSGMLDFTQIKVCFCKMLSPLKPH